MKIGLIDVDGHNFPNVALMKLSAWHKAQGDSVEWAMPLFGEYDRIYASKVFTFTPDYNQAEYNAKEFVGGVLAMISDRDCRKMLRVSQDLTTPYIHNIRSVCSSILVVASGIARSAWFTIKRVTSVPSIRCNGIPMPSG